MLRLSPTKTWTVAIAGVAAVASAVALGAGSLAYFSDTQNAPLATVSTATLKLTINDGSNVVTPVLNAEPGFSQDTLPLVFKNIGSVPGLLRLHVVPADGNTPEFNNAILIRFTGLGTPTTPATSPPTATSTPLDGSQTLTQAAAATSTGTATNGLTIATLAAGTSQNAGYSYSIDPNTGNNLQNQTGSFTITADLLQTDYITPAVTPSVTGTCRHFHGDPYATCILSFSGLTGTTDVHFKDSNGYAETDPVKNGVDQEWDIDGVADNGTVTITILGQPPVIIDITPAPSGTLG